MKKTRCLVAMAAMVFYITACGNNQNGGYHNTDTASANSGHNSSGTATGTGSDTTIGANPTDTGRTDTSGPGDTSAVKHLQ